MKSREEIRKMVSVSRLYYGNKQTQEEIAKTLGVSRPTVSRLLKQALENSIIQINIIDPLSRNKELASALCSATKLTGAVVVPGQTINREVSRRNIALAAAYYLESTLKPNDIIGIGWGRTLNEVAQAIEPHDLSGIIAVPLLGGMGQVSPSFQVHEITRRISKAFNGKWLQMFIPGLIKDRHVRENLMDSEEIKQITSLWKRLTVALVGIGDAHFDSEMDILFVDYLDNQKKDDLIKQDSVGDICMRFFNIEGKPMAYLNQENLSVELETLKNTPKVIGVAGGKQKAEAILGAINGGYINVLITDESAAQSILELLEQGL